MNDRISRRGDRGSDRDEFTLDSIPSPRVASAVADATEPTDSKSATPPPRSKEQNVAALFLALARDADNWGGTPLLGEGGTYDTVLGYDRDRGLLAHLKMRGLITTFTTCDRINDRMVTNTWARFTTAGAARAAQLGIDYFKPRND